MKSFTELVERVFNERFDTVMDRIIATKTPVAFLSADPEDQFKGLLETLRAEGMNIVSVVSVLPPPITQQLDLKQIEKITPHVKYILTCDANWNHTAARVALKYAPEVKVIGFKMFLRHALPNPIGKEKNGALAYYRGFMSHLPELYDVYNSFVDDESRKTFCGYWLGRISNLFGEYRYSLTPQYFHEGFLPKEGDVVIDCGVAGNARNSVMFASMGCKVYGFEMDKPSFDSAVKIAATKNFTVENLALGSYRHSVNYNSAGEGTTINPRGRNIAQAITLDDYVAENKIPHVDFIKMDTEGAELDILKGAVGTIAKFKPTFALSAYHRVEDLWTLTGFLKSVRPDYQFSLRHYPVQFDVAHPYYRYVDALGLYQDSRSFYELVMYAH